MAVHQSNKSLNPSFSFMRAPLLLLGSRTSEHLTSPRVGARDSSYSEGEGSVSMTESIFSYRPNAKTLLRDFALSALIGAGGPGSRSGNKSPHRPFETIGGLSS